MKKIEDYLPLYLIGEPYCETPAGIGKLITMQIVEFGFGMNPGYKEFEAKDIKPILRPLPDMTDNEIDELASILIGRETNCYHKWRSEDGNCIIADWKKEKPLTPYDKEYDYMTMGMLIDEKFSIKHKWDYHNSKGSGTTNEPLHHSHEITRYLLSRHFDLFGLIEDGLALDSTTVKDGKIK